MVKVVLEKGERIVIPYENEYNETDQLIIAKNRNGLPVIIVPFTSDASKGRKYGIISRKIEEIK